MGQQCYVCKHDVGVWFYWSSGRGFPRKSLLKSDMSKVERNFLTHGPGVPVCYKCSGKLGYGCLKDEEN